MMLHNNRVIEHTDECQRQTTDSGAVQLVSANRSASKRRALAFHLRQANFAGNRTLPQGGEQHSVGWRGERHRQERMICDLGARSDGQRYGLATGLARVVKEAEEQMKSLQVQRMR